MKSTERALLAAASLVAISPLIACNSGESTAQAQQTPQGSAGPAGPVVQAREPAQPARSRPAQRSIGGQPNILFIMGDDIGWMQPSIYHEGLMVGETPNIDRIGHEGAKFMDYIAM